MNYKIFVDSISCEHNKTLLSFEKCEYFDRNNGSVLVLGGEVLMDITIISFDGNFQFKNKRNETVSNLELTKIDICKVVETTQNQPNIVWIFKQMIESSGAIPNQCPIRKGFRFDFGSIQLDTKLFPYLPETYYVLYVNGTINRTPAMWIKVSGEILNTRKNRFNGWLNNYVYYLSENCKYFVNAGIIKVVWFLTLFFFIYLYRIYFSFSGRIKMLKLMDWWFY